MTARFGKPVALNTAMSSYSPTSQENIRFQKWLCIANFIYANTFYIPTNKNVFSRCLSAGATNGLVAGKVHRKLQPRTEVVGKVAPLFRNGIFPSERNKTSPNITFPN